MKIVVLCPKSEFTVEEQNKITKLGEVFFTASREEYPLAELIQMSQDAEILALDPDNMGGFEKTVERLPALLKAIPNLKGLALSTTAFGYVDLDYCQSRQILVTNVPHYSTESVAEHVFAFLLGISKRVFLTDQKTKQGKYELTMGYELRNKTLGVIGLGSIGSRVAELGLAFGMKVIGYNRTPKQKENVAMVSIDELLKQADYISINLADGAGTENFLSKERIKKLKPGVMIVNTADRALVDENALAEALQSGAVDSYALETEDVTSPPLGNLERAFLFKGFGWFTKEALEKNKEIWLNNIEGLALGKPVNPVS